MKTYIGTKKILAQPMTRAAYNEYRGWELPANENGDDEGYLVEYTDSPSGNDSRHAGYISWSPKDVFDRAYSATDDIPNKLTIDDLKAKIVGETFTHIGDSTTIACHLKLENGFVVTGTSACIDPAIFDKDIGMSIAYDNAVDKIWMLEGYLLKERRFNAGLN